MNLAPPSTKRLAYFLFLGIAALLFSCKKDIEQDHSYLTPQTYIENWQQNNLFRSEISLRNFEHNLHFDWNKRFVHNDINYVPAPAIAGDSLSLYRFLTYTEGGRYGIDYFLLDNAVPFKDDREIVSLGTSKIPGIVSFSSTIPASQNSSFSGTGSRLAVKKATEKVAGRNPPLAPGCNWQTVDWYYQVYVNGVLVFEVYVFSTNEIVCTEPSGGHGSGSLDTVKSNNPCDSVNMLAVNAEFKAKLDTLKQKAANSNREYSYYYSNTGANSFDETLTIGPENQLGVNIELGSAKIDGMMHNHFFMAGSSLSIFSIGDILGMIDIYRHGNMSDPYSFSMSMVNHHGGKYMLKIDDLSKFTSFAGSMNEDELKAFFRPDALISPIKPDKNGQNFSNENEASFLKFLQFTKSGLKLFKENTSTGQWNPLKHSNGQIMANPCE